MLKHAFEEPKSALLTHDPFLSVEWSIEVEQEGQFEGELNEGSRKAQEADERKISFSFPFILNLFIQGNNSELYEPVLQLAL